MIIAALDIATRTGIAVGSFRGSPKCWSSDLGKGRSEDARLSNILVLTQDVIKSYGPDLIVIESPIGGKDANAFLIGLVACARAVCANRAVVCKTVHPSTVRKHFVGVSKTARHFPGLSKQKAKEAIKQEIKARAELIGWDVPDLDSADAAACWDWACATFAKGYHAKPQGGLFA